MKNSKLSDFHTDMTLTRTQILAFFFFIQEGGQFWKCLIWVFLEGGLGFVLP